MNDYYNFNNLNFIKNIYHINILYFILYTNIIIIKNHIKNVKSLFNSILHLILMKEVSLI